MDDASVIRLSLGEPARFELIFARHFREISRFLVRRAGHSVAEDLAAETFLQAFISRHRYRSEWPSARPWLFGIATNLLRHHAREEFARLRALSRLAQATEIPTGPEESAEVSWELSVVVEAVASLDTRDRDVLLLFVWADLTYRDIAIALDIPEGTVRSRLNRARGAVREATWQAFEAQTGTPTSADAMARREPR
jgi:RNA polymerase sigma factor (sigma-70 family)